MKEKDYDARREREQYIECRYEVPAFEKLLGRAEEGSTSSNMAKKYSTHLAAGGT